MSVTNSLHRLVTATAPARPLAVARIVVAAAALAKAADVALVIPQLLNAGALRMPHAGWIPEVSAGTAWFVVGVWMLAAFAFLLGWRTRAAGAVLTASMVAVLLLDQQMYGNHFYLLILLCFLLSVADSGAAISLDAARDGERDAVPAWPVTLLKIQLSIVYGFAVITKLNLYFLSGGVLLSYWTRDGWFALPAGLQRWEVLFPLALFSLWVELALAIAMWRPQTRHHAFVLGLGLHVMIIATMGPTWRLMIFASLMFSMYLLFLDAAPRSRVVVWDDQCSFCRVWVRWFARLDWLRVHRFVGSSDSAVLTTLGISREEADAAIQMVGPDGTRAAGFRAVRSILETLPFSFLWAPLLRLPPVEHLGERVYVAVAARRKCLLPAPETGAMQVAE